VLCGKVVNILPDFPTGGAVDCTAYNAGQRGGRVRIRAHIEVVNKRTLRIKDLPYGTTTTSLIDSIIKANDQGKIHIKQVHDNTAQDVEILVQLAPGQSPAIVINALYAFTDCEISVATNACVICDDKPVFMSVNALLTYSALRTKTLLKQELMLQQSRLLEQILFASLEQIFIEQRIYHKIEDCITWEEVLSTIEYGLAPYKKGFYRPVTQKDLIQLTEIKIKRISKYDTVQAQARLQTLQHTLAQVQHDLEHLTEYAIHYFEKLQKQYGPGRERKTVLRLFDSITPRILAASSQKLYVNRKDGFIGYTLKKDELLGECSELDNVIVFRKNGTCLITKVVEKVFVGQGIVHAAVFNKHDERRVYNLIYVDGATGRAMVKRFHMLSVTRDKVYELTKGHPKSRVLYMTDNPNGEAEVVTVVLSDLAQTHKKVFDFDFATISIKGRAAQGNTLTKHAIRKIRLKTVGESTLGATDIWYDRTVGKLNRAGRGLFLGQFQNNTQILTVLKNGSYMLTHYDLNRLYDTTQIMLLELFVPAKPISVVYYNSNTQQYLAKRFRIETTTLDKQFCFIAAAKGARLVLVTTAAHPRLSITYRTPPRTATQTLHYDLATLEVRGWKAAGQRLTKHRVTRIAFSDP